MREIKMTCACVGCKSETVTRIHGVINDIQRAMLGYFCIKCIKAECSSKCRKNEKIKATGKGTL